jgi:polyphosphate kinase
VVRLVQEAAADPGVLSIKMTLYRTSGDSPIVAALEQAARNGKHVTVLVEIKARFDEARNIGWAERLSRAGVIVVYGLARLKVHAKALLVIRREEAGMKRYLHLSTGNYNDRTARLYSDLSLFTVREELCYEASLFFNAITGYSAIPVLKNLVMAPTQLKPRLIQLIEREAHRSTPEMPGCIMVKLNALADVQVIEALYQASRAGVRIFLNIRGICMLVPGISGQSENIRVTAIIDRFLEHSRLAWFQNGGQDELYCASADWMPRNLEGRVELMFPVEDEALKRRVRQALETYMADNRMSFELQSDGSWLPAGSLSDEAPVQAQAELYRRAVERNRQDAANDNKEFKVRRKPPQT